jgi:endoglycosylceramidase
VNLNALADYYQGNPAYSTVIPVTDTDREGMARSGFNVVRLVMSWSSLEPEPGRVSGEQPDLGRSVPWLAGTGLAGIKATRFGGDSPLFASVDGVYRHLRRW